MPMKTLAGRMMTKMPTKKKAMEKKRKKRKKRTTMKRTMTTMKTKTKTKRRRRLPRNPLCRAKQCRSLLWPLLVLPAFASAAQIALTWCHL